MLWPTVGKQQHAVHILHMIRHSRQACFCAVFDKHKPADSAACAHANISVLEADHTLSHQRGAFVPVMIRRAQRRVTQTLPQSTRTMKRFQPTNLNQNLLFSLNRPLSIFFFFTVHANCTRILNTSAVNCLKNASVVQI